MAAEAANGGPKKGKIFVTQVNKQEVPFGPGAVGKAAKAAKDVVESFSYRASELTKAERKKIALQNAAAKSGQSKNLDAVERGQKGAQTRRDNEEAMMAANYRMGKKVGAAKGLAAGAAAGAAAEYVVSKGSQKDHKVTSVDRKTGKAKD